MEQTKYVLAGASGFLGQALTRELAAAGHQVTRLVRRTPAGPDEVQWDPASGQLDPRTLGEPDVVFNLAGASVGRPWTPQYRAVIRESRVSTTATLANAAAKLDRPPVFLTQSGIGGYGKDCGDQLLTEETPLGDWFLGDVVRLWEGAADPAREAGCRVASLRTGVVLDQSAPALRLMALPFRLGLGGRLGSGSQYFPVVSRIDWVRAAQFVAETPAIEGPVNVTLPTPVTNADFTRALAHTLHRPAFIPVPSIALTTLLGDFSWELLGSKRALPAVLTSHHFTFNHPTAPEALAAAYPG